VVAESAALFPLALPLLKLVVTVLESAPRMVGANWKVTAVDDRGGWANLNSPISGIPA
jgi:hypothetical protein